MPGSPASAATEYRAAAGRTTNNREKHYLLVRAADLTGQRWKERDIETGEDPQIRGYMVRADEGVDDRGAEVKASSRSTGGSLAVYRSVVDGQGPPPHTHTHEDETIFVLTGVIEAECGDEVFTANEGDLIFLPRQFQHTFRSVDGPAEILFLVTPGRLDEFFRERDRLVAEGADPSEIARLISSYM